MRWVGECSTQKIYEHAFGITVGKSERVRPIGRPGLKLESDIKEIRSEFRGYIQLA
jgi:hypothetical protein